MFVKQISVFVENRFGAAADVLDILAQNNINISALSIADTSDYGIMRLIVSDPETAKNLLREQGVMVKCNRVLAIPIGDHPGGLSAVLKILAAENISIEYMYAFVGRKEDDAVVITRTDDVERAETVLRDNGMIPLSLEELI